MSSRLHAMALGVALVLAGAFPATAAGDGLPTPGVYTDPAGVVAPSGEERYVTRRGKDGSTSVRALGQNGRVLRSATVSGRLCDSRGRARRLARRALRRRVHARPDPAAQAVPADPQTHLVILDAQSLVLRDRLTLHDDFSFDAISPDGSHMYLIEYLSPRDPTEYAVRAYDLAHWDAAPRADRRPGRAERGDARLPPDARCESGRPLGLHHLRRRAASTHSSTRSTQPRGWPSCIDLPAFAHQGANNGRLSISSDGGLLTLVHRGDPVAVIDTETFSVSRPSSAPPAGQEAGSGDSGIPWSLIASAAVTALAAVGALSAFHRRRSQRLAAGDVR